MNRALRCPFIAGIETTVPFPLKSKQQFPVKPRTLMLLQEKELFLRLHTIPSEWSTKRTGAQRPDADRVSQNLEWGRYSHRTFGSRR